VTYTGAVSATYSAITGATGTLLLAIIDGSPQPSPSPIPITCIFLSGSNATVGVILPGSRPYLVFIGDAGPTGVSDTLEVLYQPGGPDCTTSPSAPIVLTSGNFTVAGPAVDVSPADGISDSLQPIGVPADSFLDASRTPATSGSIVSRAGLTVMITDAGTPEGVIVTVGDEVPGALAELAVCGNTVLVVPGSVITLTCGSLIVSVTTGQAIVDLGGGSVVTIPEGGAAEVTDSGGGSYTVANLGTIDVSLTVDGTTTAVTAGGSTITNTWTFVGFAQPLDNAPVLNRVKAGQAIPIKWGLLNGAGLPVTNLVNVSISTTTLACPLGTSVDQVEEAVAGSSGLLNLGNGYYQLNWKSAGAFAGSCKTLHLNVDSVIHDVLFQFTK
jgi:hypothetical protein